MKKSIFLGFMISLLFLPVTLRAVTPTPIEVKVSSETDDAGPNPVTNCMFATSHAEVYFGECFDGSGIISGFRFPNVPIPQGAFITSARIEFTVDGPYDNPLTLVISGEATGDAQPFSDVSRPDNRPLTDAVLPWVIPSTDHWEFHEKRQTPDLTAVVQEIVNRQDWVKGNALAIIVGNARPANRQHRRVFAFERGSATGEVAQLAVSFIPPPHPPITGCINIGDSPLVGGRVVLMQIGRVVLRPKTATTDSRGCYYFGADQVVSGKKFELIIQGPVVP